MFKTNFNAETLLWTGPDRFMTFEPDETLGKAILNALDGPERVVQVMLLIIYVYVIHNF